MTRRSRDPATAARDTAPVASPDVVGECERFEVEQDGPDLAYEHLHRYLLAGRVVAGLRVLDLASGAGYGAAILRAAGAEVFTLDASSDADHAGEAGVRGLAEHLPFGDESFDAVVFLEAIEHVPRVADALDEIGRVLRGPRILLVSTPDREIYSERAGHANPHHCSELSRRELEALLRARFRSVALHGQSLWAGSWVARIRRRSEPPGLGSRRVEALADPRSGAPERIHPAPWTRDGEELLPTPVYLLAACAGTPEGRRLVQRTLPAESVLHDARQWLLGRYFAGLREADAHLAELDRARGGAEDLESQVARARARADETARDIEALRAALRDREEDLGRSLEEARETQRRQQELEAAFADARDGFEVQVATARAAMADLEGQLARARASALDQQGQLDGAREAVGDLERQIERARANHDDQRAQVAAARKGQADLETQLERARSSAEDQEAQLDAARRTLSDQEAQLDAARRTLSDQEAQLDAARRALSDLEAQIEGARAGHDDQAAQIEAARESQVDLVAQLDRARALQADQDEQLQVARGAIEALEQQVTASRGARKELEEQLERAHREGQAHAEGLAGRTRELARVQERLDDARSQLGALTSRIGELETSIEPRLVRIALAVSRATRRIR